MKELRFSLWINAACTVGGIAISIAMWPNWIVMLNMLLAGCNLAMCLVHCIQIRERAYWQRTRRLADAQLWNGYSVGGRPLTPTRLDPDEAASLAPDLDRKAGL